MQLTPTSIISATPSSVFKFPWRIEGRATKFLPKMTLNVYATIEQAVADCEMFSESGWLDLVIRVR